MNERVEELAGQAFQFAADNADETGKGQLGVFAEKFAELLLKASFDVVINDGRFHDAKGIIRAGKYTAMEHFGVEE